MTMLAILIKVSKDQRSKTASVA